MIDTDVAIAEIDEAVVAAPAIGVDGGAGVQLAVDNALESWLRAIRYALSVDLTLTLEDDEDDDLAVSAAHAPTLDSARAKKLSSTSTTPNRGAALSQARRMRSRNPGRAGSRCYGSGRSAPALGGSSSRRRNIGRLRGSWPGKSLNASRICSSSPRRTLYPSRHTQLGKTHPPNRRPG